MSFQLPDFEQMFKDLPKQAGSIEQFAVPAIALMLTPASLAIAGWATFWGVSAGLMSMGAASSQPQPTPAPKTGAAAPMPPVSKPAGPLASAKPEAEIIDIKVAAAKAQAATAKAKAEQAKAQDAKAQRSKPAAPAPSAATPKVAAPKLVATSPASQKPAPSAAKPVVAAPATPNVKVVATPPVAPKPITAVTKDLAGAAIAKAKAEAKTGSVTALKPPEPKAPGAELKIAAKPSAKGISLPKLSIQDNKAPASLAPAEAPKGMAAPRAGGADDLKLISGIGPAIEKQLRDLGVFHFDQISGWTPKDIARFDEVLKFNGRIVRDNWIEQAKALAAGGPDEYTRRFGKAPR
ncbi:MAG: hypothetical protein WCH83_16425 [Alphaproteobacteria bacterium]